VQRLLASREGETQLDALRRQTHELVRTEIVHL
jgi:hypothetical protein